MSRLLVGSSGWSYPSWRPGFYPANARPEEFLRTYAAQLPAVELNATGYRLPSKEQFRRWAEQVPDGFSFAVKAPPLALRQPELVIDRLLALGDRLGCVRVVLAGVRDEAILERLLASFAGTRLALDLRHESWAGIAERAAAAGAVLVDGDSDAEWRYLRFRDPPYEDAALRTIAAQVQERLEAGADVFAFFRHEDEPTAPRAALRLLDLIRKADASEG